MHIIEEACCRLDSPRPTPKVLPVLHVNTPLRREEEIIKSHIEQVNHLTSQDMEKS